MSKYSDQIRNSGLMETLHDEVNKLLDDKKSGFFDLNPSEYCDHPEHNPPKHLHIPLGKGYRHVCPRCGRTHTLIPKQISF